MMRQNIANSNDHGIFTQYGFLSSATNPPPLQRVPNHENPNNPVRVDYWHPDKDYVICIINHGDDCTTNKSYYILRRNGEFIKELYDYAAVSDFFGNNIEFINSQQYSSNPVAVSQVNNPSWQNLPQQPCLIQNQAGHFTLPTIDINHFLNAPQSTHCLNLHSIIPYNHVINKMARYLHKEFPLPLSTLILIGLGVVSGMTARKWNCAYQKRGTKPICLYVVAEQKSGKGKTTALNTFQEPLRNIIDERIKKFKSIIKTKKEILDSHLAKEADDSSKEYKAKFKLKTKQLKNDLDSSNDKLKNTYALLPKTLVTPEALEESLNNTNGFFLVAADEQTLIDSLISSKGKKSNGVLLCGRNGENFYSELRTRKGYNGKVTGSFICFSQHGCIEKIIKASNETGLCERFLMISEPELPERFYQGDLQNSDDNSQELFDEYASKFEFLNSLIEKPLEHDELITLKISDNGWHFIKLFENELKTDKINGYLSHDMLSIMASKADTQIMSIASNLYLLDLDKITQPIKNGENYIPDNYISIAINIFDNLIIGVKQYCEAQGIIGNKEQIETIMNCFFNKNKNQYTNLNLHQIKHKCEQLKVFKDIKDKRQLIVDLVNWLHQSNVILFNNGMYTVNPLTQRQTQFVPYNRY